MIRFFRSRPPSVLVISSVGQASALPGATPLSSALLDSGVAFGNPWVPDRGDHQNRHATNAKLAERRDHL